jgi:SSS family solute:Na+ symporter
MVVGTGMVISMSMKTSVYPLHFAGHTIAVYAALPAAIINLLVTALVSTLMRRDTEAESNIAPLPPPTLNEV